MANIEYIRDEITGFYPVSKKLTPQYFAELQVAFRGLSDDDFKTALETHRAGDKSSYPPEAKHLASKSGVILYDEGRLVNLLACKIIDFGWDEAITRAMNWQLGLDNKLNNAVREYCIRVGINAKSEPFYGFPVWFNIFCIKLHDGDIIDAHLYASREATGDKTKAAYRKSYEFFVNVGNNKAKLYFMFHRIKRTSEYSGKYKGHFDTFKLYKAKDEYSLSEREFNDYRSEQITKLETNNDIIDEQDFPF